MLGNSTNGVPEFVAPLLPDLGCAVDVGANNGIFLSNTLEFELSGWTVLCIEPNPLLVEEGRACRRLWRQVAAGETERIADFSSVDQYPYASNSGVEIRHGGAHLTTSRHRVQMMRLDVILEQAGFHQLDLVTIDVEGYEPEVLRGLTLERWKPTILVVESLPDKIGPPAGYERIGRFEYDTVFKRL
jgi:FkbM family methyltransferase